MRIKNIIAVMAVAVLLTACSGNRDQPSTSFSPNGGQVDPGHDIQVELSFNHFMLGCDTAKTSLSLIDANGSFAMSKVVWNCSETGDMQDASGTAQITLHATSTGGSANLSFFTTDSAAFVNTAPPAPPAPKVHHVANTPAVLGSAYPLEQHPIVFSDHFRLYSETQAINNSDLILSGGAENSPTVKLHCNNYAVASSIVKYYSCEYDLPNDGTDYTKYNNVKVNYSDSTSVSVPASFSKALLAQKDGVIYYQQSSTLAITDSSAWIKLLDTKFSDISQILTTRVTSTLSSIWTVSGAAPNLQVTRFKPDGSAQETILSNTSTAHLCSSTIAGDNVYLLDGNESNGYSLSLYNANNIKSKITNFGKNEKFVNMLTEQDSPATEQVYVMTRKLDSVSPSHQYEFVVYKFSLADGALSQPDVFVVSDPSAGAATEFSFSARLFHQSQVNFKAANAVSDVRIFVTYHISVNGQDSWVLSVKTPGSIASDCLKVVPDTGFTRPVLYSYSVDSNGGSIFEFFTNGILTGLYPAGPKLAIIGNGNSYASGSPVDLQALTDSDKDAAYKELSIDSGNNIAYWTSGNKVYVARFPVTGAGLAFTNPNSSAGDWMLAVS
jgi:hypothetical protein